MTMTLMDLPNSGCDEDQKFRPIASDKEFSPQGQMMPDSIVKDLVELFKLLSDETRLKILYLLQQKKELNVRGLCQLLKQSQPAVSHHLALLRVAGLIEMRREGKHNYYRILPQRFHDLMKMMFTASPGAIDEIRFKDFVLNLSSS